MSLHPRRGTTMIELIVVVAIIALMTAVALVATSRSRVHNDVEQAMRLFAADVREAQNAALSGRRYGGTDSVCYVSAVAVPDLSSYDKYRLAYILKASAQACPKTPAGVNSLAADRHQIAFTKNLPNGVSFRNSNPPSGSWTDRARFHFNLPHGALYTDTGSGNNFNGFALLPAVRSVALTKAGVTGYVCVYPSGRVEETFQASCPTS